MTHIRAGARFATLVLVASAIFLACSFVAVYAQEVPPADASGNIDVTVISTDSSVIDTASVVEPVVSDPAQTENTDPSAPVDGVTDAPAVEETETIIDLPEPLIINAVETPTVDETTSTSESSSAPIPTQESSTDATISPEDSAATETQTAAVATTQSPELSTDKADYHPGETATIWGKFFQALQNVVMAIVGQDDAGNTIVTNTWNVQADTDGGFTTQYTLPETYVPLYLLAANSQTGELLAEATFTDSVGVTAATGGTNISADKASNATSPAYTTLGNIVIAEGSVTDIPSGQSNQTLILTAPTNWQFNPGVGSVACTVCGDVNSVSISVAASTITITFTTPNGTSGQNGSDTITISGIQARAVNGTLIPSAGNILRTAGNPGTGTVVGITNGSTNFGSLSQAVGAATKLSFNQQPTNVTANATISPPVTVRIQDQFGNQTTSTAAVSLVIGTNPSAGTLTGGGAIAAVAGTATFSGLSINNFGTGYTLVAASTGLTGTTSAAFNVAAISQSITFNGLTNKTFGDPDFSVNATASSNLSVSFSATTTSVCTVAGTTVHIVAPGICTITASQAGNATYSAAPNINQSFTVSKANTSTVVTCPASVAYTGIAQAPCSAQVTGPGGLNQSLSVSYSNNTNAGTASASASFAANANYNASADTKNFQITQASQTISFDPIANATYGDADFTVSASGGASGNPVTFSTQTPSVCTVSGASVHIVSAGTCTIRASQAGNANYSAAADVDQTASVAKANTTTVVTCPASITYDGSAQTPCAASVSGPLGLNEVLSISYTNNTDAGTANAAASYAGDTNYNGNSDNKNFTIDPASSVTTVTCPASVTFDGSAKTPCSASVSGVGGLNQSLTITYSDNTDAGTATAAASFAGDSNHSASSDNKNFTIDTATSSVVISCPTNVTYTGSALTPCSATATGAGGLNVSVLVTYGSNVNAGNATADATYAGDANHSGSSATQASFTIDKATSATVVTCSPKTSVYTSAAQTLCSVAVTGVGGLSETPAPAYADNVNVGTATALYTYAGDANHTGSNGSDTFDITKADAVCTISGYSGVYDAAAHGATGFCTGVGEDGKLEGLDLGASYTNVPGGTAYWVFTDVSGNYNSASGDVEISISKAAPTIEVSVYDVAYDGTSHSAMGSVKGVSNEDLAGLDLSGTVHTAAGTYTDTWNFVDGTGNYTDVSDTVQDTINKATSITTVTCSPSETYTGSAIEPCTATVVGDGGLSTTATVTYANNVHVGTASAVADYAGDPNHQASSDTETFEITKAKSTTVVSCAPKSAVYTGAAHTLCSVSVTGANLSLTPEPIYTANTNAGTATASYEFEGDEDHTGSQASDTFEITKAESVTVLTCADALYTGTAQETCTAHVTAAGDFNEALVVSYENNINAGTARASAKFDGDGNHEPSSDTKDFAVAQATSETVLSCPASVSYTGVAQAPCTVSIVGMGGLNETPAAVYADNTNVGTATASYNFPGDANHTASSDSKNFDIVAKTLIITASADNKIYDGTIDASATLSSDAVVGDDVVITPTTAIFADKYVGDGKSVTVAFVVSGPDSGNYTYTPSPVTTSANITKKALAISIVADDKVYDGTTFANATVHDDRVAPDVLTITSDSVTFDSKDVGTEKEVTMSGISLSGADASNYSYNTAATDHADITKASVTVTANNRSMTTGDADPDFTFEYGVFQGIDTSADIDTAPTCGVLGAHAEVTTYPIQCSGGLDNNYAFDTIDGVLTVNDKPAPVITSETTSQATTNAITVTWTTDHPATSRVVYDTVSHPTTGLAPNYDYANSTTEDATLTTNHSVTVSSLTPGTTYYFRSVSHGSPEAASSEITAGTLAQTGTITVTKIVQGGTKQTSDFPLFVDETAVASGESNTYAVGTHSISETNDVDYVPSFTGSCIADPEYAAHVSLIEGFKAKKGALLQAVYLVPNDPDNQAKLDQVADINTKISALLETLTATVELAVDENATCTITNTYIPPTGALKVNKVTVGGNGTFSLVGPTDFDITTINNTGSYTYETLRPTAYTIEEASLAVGWTQTSNTCVDVHVLPGQTVECTITNTYVAPTGTLTVAKTTLGGDGVFNFTGSNGLAPFSISTNSLTGSKNIPNVLGNFVILETPQIGWVLVDSTCDENGVDVVAGQVASCSVTNAKQGKVMVKKITIGGTGTFHFNASYNASGFDLAGGQQNDSGLIDPSIVANQYSVGEDMIDGWALTSAVCDNGNDPASITVEPGQTVTCTFTNTKVPASGHKGSISGLKFEDLNGNGVQDNGEKVLNGWTIYIDANNNGVKDKGDKWTTTRKDGTYTFKNLSSGTYVIREVLKNHWMQTAPMSGSHTVVLSSGQTVTGKNFGNFRLGRISGIKFEDKNKNGLKDPGEKHLSGWTIQLKKGTTVVATAVTGENGVYRFTDVAPGTYSIVEMQQAGWIQKTPNPSPVTVTSGTRIMRINFGNARITPSTNSDR